VILRRGPAGTVVTHRLGSLSTRAGVMSASGDADHSVGTTYPPGGWR
jgi:hypothetical protein